MQAMPSVPTDLVPRILDAIQAIRLRQIRLRLSAACAGLVLSIGYALLIWSSLVSDFQASSLGASLRLLFSDPDIVLSNLSDFILGLLEALPLVLMLTALVGIFFLLGAIMMAQSFRQARHPSSLIHHSS